MNVESVSLMRRRSTTVSARLAACLFLAAGVACSKKEAPPPPPPEVQVAEVVQKDVPIYIELVGATLGSQDIEIRSRVEGYLVSMDFIEGSFVKKGQLLYRIDPQPLEAALAETKADLATAHARLEKTNNDVARYRPLVPQQAISQQELDNALSAQQAAKAQVEALFDSLALEYLRERDRQVSFVSQRAIVIDFLGEAKGRLLEVGCGPAVMTPEARSWVSLKETNSQAREISSSSGGWPRNWEIEASFSAAVRRRSDSRIDCLSSMRLL